jgi:Antitoxin VbhA
MRNSEISANKRALEHAIAQQRIEGLTITPETLADLNRVVRGEISSDTVIANLYSRYSHVKLR